MVECSYISSTIFARPETAEWRAHCEGHDVCKGVMIGLVGLVRQAIHFNNYILITSCKSVNFSILGIGYDLGPWLTLDKGDLNVFD
jgi:hypothetical protein